MVIIITGEKGAGKSENLLRLLPLLKEQGKSVSGVISRGFWKDSVRQGYEAFNPATGEALPLANKTRYKRPGVKKFCAYYFDLSTFAAGNRWISSGADSDVMILDEAGKIEIEGLLESGWDVEAALKSRGVIILSVRLDLLGAAKKRYSLENSEIINIAPGEDISRRLLELCLGNN